MADTIRIVVVDDHPLFREGVAHSLDSDPRFEVLAEAASGEEAVEAARRLSPDMVVMDLNMSGCGGIAAAETISAILPAVRILMLTVAEDEDSLLAALKSGAHGYVLKGVAAGEFREIVRRVASGEAYVTPSLAARMLAEFGRPRPADPLSQLSQRESAVLELLGTGLTNREIGERLHLAEKTVKHYMTSILQKLHVRSRTEAALMTLRRD